MRSKTSLDFCSILSYFIKSNICNNQVTIFSLSLIDFFWFASFISSALSV